MPQNSDPNMWAEIVAYFAAAFSAVLAWAWKHTYGLLGKKAEASEMYALVARVESAFSNQRQDNQRILDKIEKVVEVHTAFTEKVIEEIGKRPTRDECGWRLHGDGREK